MHFMTEFTASKSYWSRLWSGAIAESRRFWTALRIASSFIAPVAVFIWSGIKSRHPFGWLTVGEALLYGATILVVEWGAAFVVSLALAGRNLDSERQRVVDELSQKLQLPEWGEVTILGSKLQKLDPMRERC
jgi:hypothetical protein